MEKIKQTFHHNMVTMKECIRVYVGEIKKMFRDLKVKGRRVKQIPNLLTFSRAIAPIFITPLALTGNLVPAAIMTGLFASTDFFDGKIARKLDAVSEFGKDFDAICDKLFVGGLMLPLFFQFPTLVAPFAFEALIAGVNTLSKSKGNLPRSSMFGKLKAWPLYSLIAVLYATNSFVISPSIPLCLFGTTLALQGATFADYVIKYRSQEQAKKNHVLIHVNSKENVLFEELKQEERRKRKVKTLKGKKRGREIEKKYGKKDYEKLKSEMIESPVVSFEEEKVLTLGVDPRTKDSE